MDKKLFQIPTTWIMEGNIFIEATTLEEAINYANDNINDIDLPVDGDYVFGSHQVDNDIKLIEYMNK